jgi:7-cyano-7-deazaguanine reductase
VPRRRAAPSGPVETFPNPAAGRDYEVVHTAPEFTSVCPKTGQPDFGTIVVRYVPDRLCLELKSLKLYLNAFRDRGIFYEAVVNRILDDLVGSCAPRRMEVRGDFRVRGGISSVVSASHEAPRARRAGRA